MKKRLLTLLLALSVLLSACPVALAAGGDGTRETNFFTDQFHADVNYSDMEYRHIELEPILAAMDEVRALLDDSANTEAVAEKFAAITDQFLEVVTMYTLVDIKTYQDVTDEEASEEWEYTDGLYTEVFDALVLLIQEILDSPCDAFLREQLTEEDIAYYTEYEAMTDEQFAQFNQQSALESEYMSAAYEIYTAEYDGQEWDDASLYDALLAGEVDEETYNTISRQIAKNTNSVLGGIYLRMVELRKEIAKSYGYDNFADYAYTEIYQRDYTQQEIRAFHQAVKDNIVPLYSALTTLYYYEYDNPVYVQDYTGDIALDMMEPYVHQLSSELAEAFTYMREHGLYDSGFSDVKSDSGFTTTLYAYGAPFFFNSPYGNLYDFTTAVHEFGHYNNAYWQPTGWNDGSKSMDINEVHSQALELLFTHFYEDIFGSEEDAQAVQDYLMMNLCSAIVSGCLYDELQQYVYATDNVTLDQINQEYCRLCKEYGQIDEDDPREEMYGWYYVPHTFTSPCYYISYAVSASGAFAFWLDAQDDYFSAVDSYLEFTALDATYGFQESFTQVGVESPIRAEYVEELADGLWAALEIEDRLAAAALEDLYAMPADLTGEEWFAQAVMTLYSAGAIEPDGNGYVYPYAPAIWNNAVDLVEQLILQRPDVENGEATITRGEFARLLVENLELEYSTNSPFSDTDDGAVAALAALGAVNGYEDGTFRPDQPMTRAEMWTVVYRMLMGMVDQLLAA